MSNPIDGLLTKEQTDLIFENMSDGVLMVNEDGIITYMNSACAKLLHVSAPDVIRQLLYGSVPAEQEEPRIQ